jgi:predicted outer membrane protein
LLWKIRTACRQFEQAQSRGTQMRCVSVCVVAAAAALLWAGVARAEREGEYAKPEFGASPKPPPPQAAHLLPARPAMFAAASAANARKMSPEQREERRFLKDAAAASRFEGEASRMALVRSNNAAVRTFAATLINHHASTSIALQHLLHGRGMAAPMLANDQRKILNRLAKLSGARFDREYTEEVALRYQQEGLQAYERAAMTTRDPALKAWIARSLPTMRYHLASAERLASDGKPVIALASRTSPQAAAARQSPVQPVARARNPITTREEPATQFMGAGPMQLGVTQPVAARPSESSNR